MTIKNVIEKQILNDEILNEERGSVPGWFIAKLIDINCIGELSLIRRTSADFVVNAKVSSSLWRVYETWFSVITTRPDNLECEDWSRHPATIRYLCSGSNPPEQVFYSVVTSLRRLPIDVRCSLWGTGSVELRRFSWSSSCVSLHRIWLAFAAFSYFSLGGIKFCLCIECAYGFYENEWKFYISMS